jgi:hypothetical protein
VLQQVDAIMTTGRTVRQIAGLCAASVEGVNIVDRAADLAALRLSTIPRSATLHRFDFDVHDCRRFRRPSGHDAGQVRSGLLATMNVVTRELPPLL